MMARPKSTAQFTFVILFLYQPTPKHNTIFVVPTYQWKTEIDFHSFYDSECGAIEMFVIYTTKHYEIYVVTAKKVCTKYVNCRDNNVLYTPESSLEKMDFLC